MNKIIEVILMLATDKEILGKLGGILTLVGFFLYIVSIIKDKTEKKPERATWWIWTLNSILLLTSYNAEGAKETGWLAVAYVIGCVIIALLTIKYGVGGWSILDLICLTGTVVTVVLWIKIGPLAAFISSLVIDLFGVAPTIYRSFYHPKKEDKFSWIMWLAGGFLGLLSVGNPLVFYMWSPEMFKIGAYPLQIIITDSIMIWFLFRPRYQNS